MATGAIWTLILNGPSVSSLRSRWCGRRRLARPAPIENAPDCRLRGRSGRSASPGQSERSAAPSTRRELTVALLGVVPERQFIPPLRPPLPERCGRGCCSSVVGRSTGRRRAHCRRDGPDTNRSSGPRRQVRARHPTRRRSRPLNAEAWDQPRPRRESPRRLTGSRRHHRPSGPGRRGRRDGQTSGCRVSGPLAE